METPQDEAAMHKAFQQFMIHGGTTPPVAASDPLPDIQRHSSNKEINLVKKIERKYWQILSALQGTLQRDWLEVDDHLGSIISSIANLRSRILMESRYLVKIHQQQQIPKDWQLHGYGYRPAVSSGLTKDDVELALSRDLLQHEKMMGAARSQLACLAEAQDRLGRRLEEVMLHHMESTRVMQNMEHYAEPPPSLRNVVTLVESLQLVFASLAMELYRKQCLVQQVLDAVHDDLLVATDGDDGNETIEMSDNDGVNCIRVAEKASREWPRGSKTSNLNMDQLEDLLQLGERGDDSQQN